MTTYEPINDYPHDGSEAIISADYPAVDTDQIRARVDYLREIQAGHAQGAVFGLGTASLQELARHEAELAHREGTSK